MNVLPDLRRASLGQGQHYPMENTGCYNFLDPWYSFMAPQGAVHDMKHHEHALAAIEAFGLERHFGTTKAVDGVDLRVERGSVFGLLGPNGAGKTTLVRILATLLLPHAGTARVFGHDVVNEPDEVRSRISLTGQFASLDEDLTGSENLVMIARLYGFDRRAARERAMFLLDSFGLSDAADRQVKSFSGGMRRRIDIAASLVVTPDLIFLDEPTTGLDPRRRNQVWSIIRALAAAGTTVLLTTQYLDEADQLTDRIAVVDHGRIIAEGTSGELKAQVGNSALHVRVARAEQRQSALRVLENVLNTTVVPGNDAFSCHASVEDGAIAGDAMISLAKEGIEVTDFSLGRPSLDEVFLALTGTTATEEAHA